MTPTKSLTSEVRLPSSRFVGEQDAIGFIALIHGVEVSRTQQVAAE